MIMLGAALWWSNASPEGYSSFWNYTLSPSSHWSLQFLVNDVLMAIFFLSVGLEIKHEILHGKLASVRRAALPVMAALGGMFCPAVIYLLWNYGRPSAGGWGVPMATDIAFSLGILSLLGKRVPLSIRTFVTALAIVDDLGAVVVIAIWYNNAIALLPLSLAAGCMIVLFFLQRLQSLTLYLAVGALLWYGIFTSGLHATIAGVLLAIMIPDVPRDSTGISPLHRLAEILRPIVAFAIIPLFVIANAGVVIDRSIISTVDHNVFLGIGAGLVVGKMVGVFGFSYVAVKLGLGALPENTSWAQMFGASIVCGIGFTMSLFIAQLAFGAEALQFASAKLAILLASLVASVLGSLTILAQKRVE